MSLWRGPLREDDPLPEPDWQDRVVAVLRGNGRLSDDTRDAFTDWTRELARITRGAVYSRPSDRFVYVWVDLEAQATATRARELLAADEFAALAAWIRELAAAPRNSRS